MACRLIRRSVLLSRIPPENFDEFKPNPWKKILVWIGILVFSFGFWIVVGMMLSGCATAGEIPEHKAVLAIIGEAENQGFEGMLAIAHAIRNRGTLKGVYGLHAPRVKKHLYSREILQQATLAWEQSDVDYDLTHGATGWGNRYDIQKFQMCEWWDHCMVTAKIGDHLFYREVK